MKAKTQRLIYAIVAIVTVALIVSLTAWAAVGSGGASDLRVTEGEVRFGEEPVRSEYLVGEEVDTEGLSLHAGGKTFSGEELTVTVDNTTAGDKMVEVSHRAGNDFYRGYFAVKYFAVRHLDLRRAPTDIFFDEEGNLTGVEGMVIWAELSDEPSQFERPEEYPEYTTTVVLSPENYTLAMQPQDERGGYAAEITCGKVTTGFYFVRVGEKTLILDSPARVMELKNESGTEDKLTLYVTSWGATDGDRLNIAEGYYHFQGADGTERLLRFGYYLQNVTWASFFHSADYGEGVREERREAEEDSVVVTYKGLTFRAASADWRRAILNS